MRTISAYQPSDLGIIAEFVSAIREYERAAVPELKPGHEIAQSYAEQLVRLTSERMGCIFLAKTKARPIGFICAWIDEDDDPLLREETRSHAYVSDLFVDEAWRRKGVASHLLGAAENEMRLRGCKRIRICSKAANTAAIGCYGRAGFQAYEVIFTKSLAE